jgi:enoyl-CoA hydratase
VSAARDSGRVNLTLDDDIARVRFERPAARNAMTFAMYEALHEVCERIDAAPRLRAAVFRGAGEAFVAGTDIAEFTSFASGEDGLAYEARVEAVISRIEAIRVPTLAAIDGPATGGGLVIAAACDLRIVTTRARLGVPIARTLGNCLSSENLARLRRGLGDAPTRALILLASLLSGADAHRLGFALDCVEPDALDERVEAALLALRTGAPLTHGASLEAFRRLEAGDRNDADLIARIYTSADFREGVSAFLAKRPPQWSGS